MMSESQIQELKERFADWLDEEQAIGCMADDIVRTADSVDGFIAACREHQGIETEMMDSLQVTIIRKSQRFKGEARKDLYILNAEKHVRLVLAM